jgi:hypothetical protein
MYELFFEKHPYPTTTEAFGNMWYLGIEIANNGKRPALPELETTKFSEKELQYLMLMQKCWQSNSNDRPSFDEIANIIAVLKI